MDNTRFKAGDSEGSVTLQSMNVQDIPLNELEISPSNVRRRQIMADIDELARSLAMDGLQQPIVVQQHNGPTVHRWMSWRWPSRGLHGR